MNKIFLLGIFAGSLGLVLPTAPAVEERHVIERVADVRVLPRADAAQGMPVSIRGVVTFRDGKDSFYVDDGEGIHVRTRGEPSEDGKPSGTPAVGDLVELTGVTMPGSFAPSISVQTLRVVGRKPLPAPHEVTVADLMSGKYTGQRVAVRGIVQQINTEQKEGGQIQEMDLACTDGHVLANLSSSAVLETQSWVDAEARVVGVNQGILNSRGELIGARIGSNSSDDFTRLVAPPSGPWDGPLMDADLIQPFSPQGFSPHRVRLAGVVTLCVPGVFLYLERNGRGIRVHTSQQDVFAPGDLIEATGFAEGGTQFVELKNAVCRRTGVTDPPLPVAIDPEQIYAMKTDSPGRDVEDFDGRLVSIQGVIEGTDPTPEEGTRVTFRSGKRMVRAIIAPGEGAKRVARLVEGSVVRLTGICVIEFSESPVRPVLAPPYVRRFLLNMRTAGDVEVLALPSWWTPQRLWLALAAVAAILLGSLAWGTSLQRLLRQRTGRLEKVMQTHRNAELEFKSAQQERLRLAGDLHDGLQQMIAGAAYRIEAAEARLTDSTPELLQQFAAARQALVRAQTQLRECVWGLREIEQDTDDFTALLRHAVSSIEHWPQGAVEVLQKGEPFALSRYVMGNLLLLMQEAVGNAFKHGRAKRATITLTYHSEELEMSIRDDGAGFDTAVSRDSRQGHYGLESIQQRMKWLGGTVEITSSPGKGASIVCRLSRAQSSLRESQNPLNGG